MILALFSLLAPLAVAGGTPGKTSSPSSSTQDDYCETLGPLCVNPGPGKGYQETLPDDIMPIPTDVVSRVNVLMGTASSLKYQAIDVTFEKGQTVHALVVLPSGSTTAYFLAPATSALWAVGTLSVSGSTFKVGSVEWITASPTKVTATFR